MWSTMLASPLGDPWSKAKASRAEDLDVAMGPTAGASSTAICLHCGRSDGDAASDPTEPPPRRQSA